jgi:hypothetical protein
MTYRFLAAMLALLAAGTAVSEDAKVHFVGSFESGRIGSNGTTRDGFYLATVPNPQSGSTALLSGDSEFGPSSNADTRVVRSEDIGGQTVLPRKGQYFLRTEVYRDKNYMVLNDWVKNKPRSKIYLTHDAHRIGFDKEGYAGFSIFVPRNFENELGVRDHRGDAMLFEMCTDSSRTLVNLGVWVQSPATEAHWFLRTWTSSTSIREDNNSKMEMIDLGPVSADKGKWTDFVFRYRYNPFTVDTNPAQKGIDGAANQLFQGNRGILQVWKAEGAVDGDGNRDMVLKVNKVNVPVGLVPTKENNIKHLWRIYKYGWLSNPTTLTHPVWFGFDEIRQGLVERDGTTFADVAPAGAECTSGCAGEEPAAPKPPTSLAVE